MFDPPRLCAVGPFEAIAAARNWVVVLLPLVAETSATSRLAARALSTPGCRRSATSPPMTPPEPLPSLRDSPLATRPAARAKLARGGRAR